MMSSYLLDTTLALELWTWFMGSLRTFRDQRRFVFLI